MEKSKERRVINNNNGGVGAKAMAMKRRMRGLKKKLREFSSLCDVDTLMIAYNRSKGEVIDTWPENQLDLNRVISRCVSVDKAERDKRGINLVDHNNGGRCEDDMKNVIYGGDEKKLREMVSSLNNKLDKVKKLADSRSEKDRLQNIVPYNDNAVVNDGVPPAYYCHGEPVQSIKASCQAWSSSTNNPNLVLQPEPSFIESMVPETVMPCDDPLWEELRDYVVGVVIGIVVGVGREGAHKHTNGRESGMANGMKAVDTLCSTTQYKEACMNTLGPAASNNSITPKDLVHIAIKTTLVEVRKVIEKSGPIGNTPNMNSTHKMAFQDCQKLFDYAVDELQASMSMVGDSDLHTMDDRIVELKNWLSAVISYYETCLDGLEAHPEMKSAMQNGMVNATQLTSNALAIASEISSILKSFNIDINLPNPNSRKLLAAEDGFPSWFSVADRRLLARHAAGQRVTPNVVVALDGSGQYKSINAALKAYPKNHKGRFVIYVKAGVYRENVLIEKDLPNIFMYGDGPRKSIITGKRSNTGGYPTFQTATFAVVAPGFIAKAMGFSNTAGPQGHQAVALRSQSDMSAYFNCRMDGYQDTLYAQTHRQFYRNCVISGTVDFIFGDGSTLIQNCLIIVRKPMDSQQNTVTAHGRTDKNEPTGIVIQNCRIVPEQKLFPDRLKIPTYLGRPWKKFSRTVIMESTLGDFIQPDGWMPWAGTFALDTLYYAEFGNRGPGSGTNRRVKWRGYRVIDRREALQFTADPFIQGKTWLRYTGAPYMLGFKR
ncbi:hypothetical protein Syun_008190 [Stephania yunnanensis]|uniref:pectinesterase n=1 Tax=Stephania yunnanensis TaxID=152371 RepID=A0AAP0L3P7_9MAGN